MGGVQLLYTKWVTHSFSMEVQIINCKSFNISEVSFPNLELSAYKTLLPQQVIKISHAHDENAEGDCGMDRVRQCCLLTPKVHHKLLAQEKIYILQARWQTGL